jgi:hypothetical protein
VRTRLRVETRRGLLEAELRAAYLREVRHAEPPELARISWIIPERPLHEEIRRVLAHGYLRGADCWHLAVALYAAPEPEELLFISLHERQARIARQLGFAT